MEILRGHLKQYDLGKYPASKYQNSEEITSACIDGKTFVFKGGGGFLCGCCSILFTFMFAIIWFSGMASQSEETGGFFIMLVIGLWALTIYYFARLARTFIVAGPDGLLYRRLSKTFYFDWSSIRFIHRTHFISGPNQYVVIRIFPKEGKQKVISTLDFQSNEMPRGERHLMIAQVIYAHWIIKTKKATTQGSMEDFLKEWGGTSNFQDPSAPF